MDNTIFYLKDYGTVNLKIDQKMKELNITRNKMSKITGCTYNVINRYYSNTVARIDRDVLARICFVLDCKIEDVLEYTK